MSEDQAELNRLAHKSFGELLSDGFSLFWKNWTKVILPMAFFFIISIIIRNIFLVDLQWNLILLESSVVPLLDSDPATISPEDLQLMLDYLTASLTTGLLDLIIANIFTVLSLCSVASFLFKRYSNYHTRLFNEIKGIINKRTIMILFLLGFLIPLGIFTLFITSIIVFGFFIFSVYTYKLESVEKPIKTARSYSKGSFWRIIGVLVVSSLIIFIINVVYQLFIGFFLPFNSSITISWYNPITRRIELLILYDLINNLIILLFDPLFICLLTPLFASSRARKKLLQPLIGSTKSSNSSYLNNDALKQPEFREKGIYCPFCGVHMEFKLNYCPNCGKQLNFKI